MAKKSTHGNSSHRVRLVDGTLADPASCKEENGKMVSELGVPVALDDAGEPIHVDMVPGTYHGPDADAGDKLAGISHQADTVEKKAE